MAISSQPKLNAISTGASVGSGEGDEVGEGVGVCVGVGLGVGVGVGVGVGLAVIVTAFEGGEVTGIEALSVILQVTEAGLFDTT